jgi:hypothetical protein
MDLIDYDDSARFLERAAPVSGRNEAFTGLIYGFADRVGRIADLDPDERSWHRWKKPVRCDSSPS